MSFVDFLDRDSTTAARLLLGCNLIRQIDGEQVVVKIVETESYDQADAASHSYKGKTPRTEVMFGPSGYLYVYFTYGMHYCCNVVTGQSGEGSAVLIRAVEPVKGESVLEARRNKFGVELTNGPAKLCQALGIDKSMNGHDLRAEPLILESADAVPDSMVVAAKRVGISRAVDEMRRFYIKDNPYISTP